MSCRAWPPPRRPNPLHVSLPGSILSTEPTLQLKTIKAGIVARALAVYRVDHVWLYRDPDTSRQDLRLLSLLLRYAVTPPHLKKKLFPHTPALRFVGLMPPLNLASHEPPSEPKEGAVIDGLVEECRGAICRVYLGSLGYGILRGGAREGDVVTVRIASQSPKGLLLERASWGDVYTGFRVSMKSSVSELIRAARSSGLRVVATSRLGRCAGQLENTGLLIVFGGPERGLLEYLDQKEFDDIVNTIPLQGTRTVRTEEAIHATLSRIVDPL